MPLCRSNCIISLDRRAHTRKYVNTYPAEAWGVRGVKPPKAYVMWKGIVGMWITIAIVAGLAALPFVIEARRRKMDATARASASGEFTELSQGVTYYQWHGKARGPVCVCVHGLTTPSFVFAALAQGLGALGFRVLTYDLYGRGYSDRPNGAQNAEFFLRQLEDLLAAHDIRDDITMVGYSMGGAIASAYAAKSPGKLRRLVLIAPAGIEMQRGKAVERLLSLPVLGDWALSLLLPASMRKAAHADEAASKVEGLAQGQRDEILYRGYVPAVLASIRGILDEDFEARHQAISRADLPVMAIWGETDQTIPLRAMGTLTKWNRMVHHTVVEGAGHGLTHTHPDAILDAIRAEVQGE